MQNSLETFPTQLHHVLTTSIPGGSALQITQADIKCNGVKGVTRNKQALAHCTHARYINVTARNGMQEPFDHVTGGTSHAWIFRKLLAKEVAYL
ncbi:hypothetical protein VTO73DRAFT_11207 [Trametes versicolor]